MKLKTFTWKILNILIIKLILKIIYYFIFHPINCQIEVENNNTKGNFLNKYKGFSYDIEKALLEYSFNIKRVDNYTRNSCLVYASTFTYSKSDYNQTFLILQNKIPQYYFFHDVYEINFLYYYTEIDNDLLVDFKMNNSSNYSNYQKGNENYYLFYTTDNCPSKVGPELIYNNKSFKIYSSFMKTFCTFGNQPCLIRFLVQSKYKKDSIIELNVTTIENDIIIFAKSKFKTKFRTRFKT